MAPKVLSNKEISSDYYSF